MRYDTAQSDAKSRTIASPAIQTGLAPISAYSRPVVSTRFHSTTCDLDDAASLSAIDRAWLQSVALATCLRTRIRRLVFVDLLHHGLERRDELRRFQWLVPARD